MIKSTDKGLVIVVWDREGYVKDTETGDEEVYEEDYNDAPTSSECNHKCSHSKSKKTGWSKKGYLRLIYCERSKISKVLCPT